KMAGHMGAERVTVQNLQVVSTDVDSGVVLVRGAVPGSKGGWVMLRDAVKHALPEGVPMPGGVRKAAELASEEAAAPAPAAAEEPAVETPVEAAAETAAVDTAPEATDAEAPAADQDEKKD
ncbi:MAG: hypothetical protein KDA64_14425, partial [Rhodospirillaceae bacterium]|nr:hypothetical protein [Rhodospirillaceae bacterium]